MRTMTRTVGRVAMVAVASGAMGACQSAPARGGKPTPAEQTVAPKPAPAPGKDYTERLVLSDLRERAIGVIEAGARDAAPEVRTNAVEAVEKMPSRATPILAASLKDESAAVRTVAAMAVGNIKARGLVASVRPLLDDPSGFARAAAIYALTACGERVDPSPLSSMLLSDPSTRLRSHVAVIIGLMGNPTALPLLKQAAHEGAPRARQEEEKLLQLQLAEAMVRLGDYQSVHAIYSSLYPGQPEELEAAALAAQILGELRDRPSVDRLIYLIEYKNPQGQRYSAEVRLAATTSLGRLGVVRGGFVADEFWASPTPALRAQSAFAYGEIGTPEALARLDAMMGDADPRVRIAAANGVLNIVDVLKGPRTRNTTDR